MAGKAGEKGWAYVAEVLGGRMSAVEVISVEGTEDVLAKISYDRKDAYIVNKDISGMCWVYLKQKR